MKSRTRPSVDFLCEFANYGLFDVLEDFIIRYIDIPTIFKICQVSTSWRGILNNDYIWRKKALRHGIVENELELEETKNVLAEKQQVLPSFCNWGKHFKRIVKRKRNFVKGKFRKRYIPSLYENIFEETESFSSCMDIQNGKLVFGSESGSIILWIPSVNGSCDYLKKFNISCSKINMVYIDGSRICVFESGRVLVYSIKDFDIFHNITLVLELNTGVTHFERLSVSAEADLCVFSTIGTRNLTKLKLSTCSQETFCIHKEWKVKKLKLCTDKNLRNLLLVLASDEVNDTILVFYDIEKHTIISKYNATEFDGPQDPVITFFEDGIFVESSMTAEDDIKMNMWTFFNFEGRKVGSYIYESKLGSITSSNKTGLTFGHGSFEATSFSLEKNSLIFGEKESRKLDTLQRHTVEILDNSVKLDRDWMNSYPNNDRYDTGKGPVIGSSSLNKIIIKTSSNKRLLSVMDQIRGDKIYNIPIDMIVDQMLIQDGFVVLVNSNNMLLSIILDFNI